MLFGLAYFSSLIWASKGCSVKETLSFRNRKRGLQYTTYLYIPNCQCVGTVGKMLHVSCNEGTGQHFISMSLPTS
ncbi:hypothetical protein QR685DRAFT_569622 [Neurospora intermedia]|uniref:Secreted protein n=1 Tax=Neurospora intermedia TaxID=5142 RepID=A0ABR3DLN8_NEUIN